MILIFSDGGFEFKHGTTRKEFEQFKADGKSGKYKLQEGWEVMAEMFWMNVVNH